MLESGLTKTSSKRCDTREVYRTEGCTEGRNVHVWEGVKCEGRKWDFGRVKLDTVSIKRL